MAWSQTIISTSLNMSGGFSGGALDSSVVTLTVASGAGILSGAYFIAGDVPCSISVRSGNNLTAVTQARVRIPPIANGTPLTIYNPITQSGTDDGSTGANLAFSGLAGFPSTIINCFSSAASISTALVDVSGGAQIGATTIVVDNGSGQPPAIIPPVLGRFTIGSITYTVTNYDAATRTITLSAPLIAAIADNTSLSIAPTSLVLGVNSGPVGNLPISPPPFTSFYYNNTLHYVVAFDAGTNQITFAPALSANIAANARLQLTTPGVTIDSRTSSIGATSYSVNSTRLQVAGTLSWNSFVEQLILNRGCPIALYGSPSPELLSVVYVTGTMNISGRRPPGWGLNSGDNSAHPAFIARTSSTTALATASGSAVNTSNCVFYSDGSIAIRLGTHSHTSVTYASDIGGRNLSEGPLFTLNGSITDIQLNGLYHSMNAIHLSGIQFNNTTALFLTRVSANASLALNLSFRNNPTPFAFASNALNPGTSSLYALNLEAGSRQNIIIVAENHPSQGGQGVFLKQVSHYCKNIANTPISSVKINAKDTLNGQHFDWFALTQNATSFPTSALGAVWDGALQKSYNWLTSSTGFTGDRVVVESGGTIGSTSLVINNGTTGQAPSITPEIRQHFTFTIAGVNYSHTITGYVSGTRTLSIIPALTVALPATTELQVNPSVILAYLCNPNRRAINVSAVAMATANIGATTVNVNNGTTALSPDLQVNGTFVVAGIRHVITAVTAITSGHQLTFTPALQAQIVASAVVAIQNLHFDYRNKTSYSAVVSVNANSGSSSLRVNNGSGLFAIAPPINTVFTYANVLYFVTAVTTNASDYTLTLFPSLQASAAVGTPITIRNVQGQDAFDFYSSSYLHLPQQQELTLTGTGTLTNNWQILDDASITQTNKATVDAYTTITTAAQFYDRAKSWWYDNFETLPASQQGAVLVTRAGTVLNAGAYNITLNNAAGAVFAFASNTITIKTATFTDTLTTTGTITLSQTGTYSAGIVPATGTVAIAAAGTYDLSGWTFASGATISNTSGGAVIVLVRYAEISNITTTGGNISVRSSPVTFSGFPTANNANGVAPAPKFGLYSAINNAWTFYNVSSGSVQVSLSTVGPDSSFLAVADAIGWIRPPAQTIQANRVDNFSWADLYEEFTAEDGTAIIGAIPDPLPISYSQANNRFELKSGENLTFAEVAATKEALTSSETGIQAFDTATLRQIQFISNSAYKRVILPNAFTVALQADATAGAILIDFLLLREGATPGTYADPFAHGLASTASGLTDRPEVVTAFQNATFVGLTGPEIRQAVGLASANLDTQLANINSKTTNLPATFPVVDGSGRVTVGTNADKEGYGLADNALTAAKIATDAIDADALAASAVTEIQAGLATQASLDTKASQASVDALPNPGSIADAVWDEALSGHTIAGSTGKKLADTSTLTVGDIPAGLSAQQVWEYTTRALTGTQATNLAAIPNIPTNPLLTNDARLNNLDTTISSRSTLTTAQIRTELATELARLDVAVSTRLAAANYTTPPTTSQIAAAVEAALLNDADGQALLAAIQAAVQALFDQQADIPVSTLVSLIAAQITADHGSGSYTTANVSALALEATAQGIKAKTDNLPSDPADQSELVTLINTKASQASVNAIPTTPLLAANYTAPDNAGIAAIKAKTDNLPSDPADQSELATLISAIPTVAPDNAGIAAIKAKTDNLPSDPADQSELVTLINTKASQASVDAIPTTPLLAANYTAPDNAGIAAIKAKTDNLPSDPADQSALVTLISAIPTNPLLATNYTAPDNTGIAAIKAKTDNLPSDPADQSELVTLINTRLAAANYVAPNNTGILTAIGSLPSASTIADAVWDEALSGHTIAGSTGKKLADTSTLTVGDIPAGLTAAQVWQYASRELTGTQATNLATIPNIPTNPLLAANYVAPDNAGIANTLSLVQASVTGRFKINYPGKAFQYNRDGTLLQEFNLLDAQGNPAISAQTAVDRVPVGEANPAIPVVGLNGLVYWS